MKKLLLLAAVVFGMSASAVAQEKTVLSDNWSIGLKGGGITPERHYPFWKSMRGVAGLEITKQITPVFGLGVEGEAMVNTSSWAGHSSNVFDQSYVGFFGTVNLMNLLGGYNGAPRVFEIEVVGGSGWGHFFVPKKEGLDANTLNTKVGLNLNFNLGSSKAWTFSLKPSVGWMVAGYDSQKNYEFASNFSHDLCTVELLAGFTYHFKNSQGEHHFTKVRAYDQREVDGLNARINALRGELEAAKEDLDACNARNKALAEELDACKNRKPDVQVKEVVKEVVKKSDVPDVIVTFGQGKATIDNSQLPNVERVATYLKNNKSARVEINGYASPEGSKEVNERLAKARAEAVKAQLIKRYNISASRITAKGLGVGEVFSEPDWNRVSICTIEK